MGNSLTESAPRCCATWSKKRAWTRLRAAAGQYGVDLEALHPALGAQPQPYEEGRRPPETTPARLLPAFVSTMEALAADRPVWLVIEDLQWVDGSSRDLLNYLVRVVSDCHLLLAVTVRTDDRHPDPAAAAMTLWSTARSVL